MTKLLIALGAFFGIIYFFVYQLKKFVRSVIPPQDDERFKHSSGNSQQRINKGEMIECPSCGIYFPSESGTIKKSLSGRKVFCSEKCAKQGEQ